MRDQACAEITTHGAPTVDTHGAARHVPGTQFDETAPSGNFTMPDGPGEAETSFDLFDHDFPGYAAAGTPTSTRLPQQPQHPHAPPPPQHATGWGGAHGKR